MGQKGILKLHTSLLAFVHGLLALQRGSSFVVRTAFSPRSLLVPTQFRYATDSNAYEASNTTSAGVLNGDSMELKGAKNDKLQNDKLSQSNAEEESRKVEGSFGDIMSRDDKGIVASKRPGNLSDLVSRRDGLVTSAMQSGTLFSRFGIEHPLDRMALTANGNLQRLVSSYYDAPVEVLVDYCRPIQNDDKSGLGQVKQWDRLVHLNVHNQTFCKAHSVITVYDPLCQKLVESGEVGLGQLFRYLDILPEFELQNAAPYPTETGGGFWREYSLECAELSCFIHEDFQKGIWDLHPQQS